MHHATAATLHRIGARVLVAPPELTVTPEAGQIVMTIEAGGAFGDGAHPTTQLCLAALARHTRPGALIDLGSGTGILAIAAAKLGAAPVLAVEIDAAAVQIARANVARNGVAASVQVEQGSLAEVIAGRFGITQAPLVVANILAHVLVDFFAQGLADVVTPGGLLILSGILHMQGPEIRARLGWHGLTQVAEERRNDWLCVIAKRAV
ncbi:MAG TPA: methyltransferase [Chloroflexi bacterium]|nr:methyltransferase [Chloroflexota bacterium]